MKKILSVLCVVFLAFTLVACLGSTSETKKENVASLAQFEQVQTGMTYDEVVAIFGFEGTKASTVENMDTYTWQGNDSVSHAIITFTDGVVAATMQVGLK